MKEQFESQDTGCDDIDLTRSAYPVELGTRHPLTIVKNEIIDQAVSPEDTLISEELFSRYVKALDRLPERCREVFIRIREEKQTYAQVAEELGISTKTVDAQLQKATIRLKEILL